MLPPRVDAPQIAPMKPVQQPKVAPMRGIDEALDYYLGPTGIPDKLRAVNSMFNPVEAVGGSMRASQRLFAPETDGWGRVQAAGDMLSGIGGFVAPMVAAAKVGAPAASAVVDAFTGLNPGFAADESGGMKLYHGTGNDWSGDIRSPFFATPDRSGAEWYAANRGDSAPRVVEFDADIKNAFALANEADAKKLSDLLMSAGLDPEFTPSTPQRGWEFYWPKIAENSPYEGTNIMDVAYVPEAREALARQGYDALYDPYAPLENTDIPEYAIFDPAALKLPPVAPMKPLTPAQEVADMLASGRAGEVTDDLRGSVDPQEMWNLYKTGATGMEMPLDEASRMARAKGMGHVDPGLHGTYAEEDYSTFGRPRASLRRESYFSPANKADFASSFADNDGGRVLPVMLRSGDFIDGRTTPGNEKLMEILWDNNLDTDFRLHRTDGETKRLPDWGEQNVIDAVNRSGATGLRLQERPGMTSEAVFDPTAIRSRFAIFDPRLKHLANLSAAGAGAVYLAPDERRGIAMGR
jgi:hypothetical protein